MKGYKGFDKDLKCRDMQYEAGGAFEAPTAEICNCGLHFCEYPLDVFGYYPPADGRYCEVSSDNVTSETSDDSKRVATRLEIGAEIGIPGMVGDSVNYIIERVKPDKSKGAHKTEDGSLATNTGNRSAATNTGNWSAATNTGYRSAATNTGNWSAATNTGYRSAAINTGNWSAATNTGDRSAAINTGNWSAATNTGYRSAASVCGQDSVAIATGYRSKVKGELGCAICCIEKDEFYKIIGIASAIVDGKIIKPNIWYTVENGSFVEVEPRNSEQEASHA